MEPLFTIGYGNRPLDGFLAALSRRRIRYLIDVRSNPRSRYRPEFSGDELPGLLKRACISYVSMGDSLGGRPEDPTCYRNGRVVYDVVRERRFFRAGIQRIQNALSRNLRICLMCSEGKPENCHRSKLIGVTLDAVGIQVIHIGAQDEELSQQDVLAKLEPSQSNLFGNKLTSRKAHRLGRSERVFDW